VALVTGGGRGLGAAICLGLAEDGADVAVNYSRSADDAAEVVAAVEKLGRRAIAVQGSVADPADDARMVEEVVDQLGGLSILVHNAGVASRGRSVAKTDPDELVKVLGVHAIGPHHLTREALPHLRQGDRGDIVFISSIATRHHQPGGAPYSMGKAAMESLAFTLAKEEREKGIHVNVLAPGLIRTEMGRKLVRSWGVEDIDSMDANAPFGHVLRPEEAADVVRFFVSDAARYVTGERIYLDGGGVTPSS
jgi:NAD(P)-dependent dehydrogenase (short-subunit alcohol dehydrogenase family)